MPPRLILATLLLTACSDPPLGDVLRGDLSAPHPEGGAGDLALADLLPGDLPPQEDPDLAGAADLLPPLYPPGPYGNRVGDTLADLVLPGYRLDLQHTDSSKLPWSLDISLADYHRNPACKCLVIDWCASWAGTCQAQQAQMIADVVADPAYCILEILQEGPQNGSNKVTMQDVSDWTRQFHQNFFVVQGNNASRDLWTGWGNVIGLPFALIVKPSTMKVVGSFHGFGANMHDQATMLCR